MGLRLGRSDAGERGRASPDRRVQAVAAAAVALDGLDAIVFTAGAGEIGAAVASVRVLVIVSREDPVIARAVRQTLAASLPTVNGTLGRSLFGAG